MPDIVTPPLRILSAGSLRAALTAHAAGRPAPLPELVFGPAGLLRERIEQGETCDLYLSADLDHPRRLAAARPGTEVIRFARNRIVAAARREIGLRTENFLDVLLGPAIRLGTSTPGADPGGDYAVALFHRAGALRDGAAQLLAGKAQHLVGGTMPSGPAGPHPLRHFLETGVVDMVLCYRSGSRELAQDFDVVTPPPALEVIAEYGLILLAEDPAHRQAAADFIAALLSSAGRTQLTRHGFEVPE